MRLRVALEGLLHLQIAIPRVPTLNASLDASLNIGGAVDQGFPLGLIPRVVPTGDHSPSLLASHFHHF